jgi:hypothetical protein
MNVKPFFEVLANHSLMNHQFDAQILKHKKRRLYVSGLMVYGYSVQLFALIRSELNFSIDWVHVTDEKFGSLDSESNEWNGVVRMIIQNEIDTSILDLAISKERKSVISYSAPIIRYHLALFIQKPGPKWSWTTFLDVFSQVYWLTVCAFISCFTVCLYVLAIFSTTDEDEKLTVAMKIEYLVRSITQCLRIFVMLDIKKLNDTSSRVPNAKRIFTLVMYFCGMLNFYVYTAGLISYLMIQHYDIPIDTLDDLFEKPSFRLLLLEGSAQEDYLRHSTNPNYKTIWKTTKEQNGLISSYKEGEMQLMEDEEKVYFGYSPYFELVSDIYPCYIVKTRAKYSPQDGAYPFNKNSPYIEVFSHQIDKVLEHGLETERQQASKPDDTKCEKQNAEYFRTLSYNDLNSAFGAFVLGCFLAFLYSATEFLYKRYYALNNDDSQLEKDESSEI